MAFSGIHITFGYHGPNGMRGCAHAETMGKLTASETMASAGVTTAFAPDAKEGIGMPLVRIQPKADSFVAIGQEPDAVNGPRTLVRAGANDEFYCEPGDRVAWVAA